MEQDGPRLEPVLLQLLCVSFARKVSHPQSHHVKRGKTMPSPPSPPPAGVWGWCDRTCPGHSEPSRPTFPHSVSPLITQEQLTCLPKLNTTRLSNGPSSDRHLGTVGLGHPIIRAPQVSSADSRERICPLGFWLFPLRAGSWLDVALLDLYPLPTPTPPGCSVSHRSPRDPGFPGPSPASLHNCFWPSPVPLALTAGHIHCNSYISSPEPQIPHGPLS